MEENEGVRAQQRRQPPAAPLASLTLSSSAVARPSSCRVAALRSVPPVRSSRAVPRLLPLPGTTSASLRDTATAAGGGTTTSTAQQQRRRRQGGFKPWAVPLAAGAVVLHLARSAASHVLAPGLTAPGRQPPAAGESRVLPRLLPRRIAGGTRGPAAFPGGRRPALVWFRNDLRLHDHEPLAAANTAATSLLPVYVFDPREFGKADSGFDKTGPYRARFILEALADLRGRLRDAGSDLLLRIGKPEEVLPELAAAVGAGAVYCHGEVTPEEAAVEAAVARALDKTGAALKVCWGGTLFHVDDLPFKLQAMPPAYSDFRKALTGRGVRQPVAAPAQLRGLPAASVCPGELPSLQQLGFDAATLARCAADNSASAAHLCGGETEALRRLSAFVCNFASTSSGAGSSSSSGDSNAWAAAAKGSSAAVSSSSSNSSFCCKISPWLALGCLSPRQLYVELQNKAGRQQEVGGSSSSAAVMAAAAPAGGAAGPQPPGREGDSGMQWLLFELLWRDFFRFITKKYTLTGVAKQLRKRSAGLQEVPAAPALAVA